MSDWDNPTPSRGLSPWKVILAVGIPALMAFHRCDRSMQRQQAFERENERFRVESQQREELRLHSGIDTGYVPMLAFCTNIEARLRGGLSAEALDAARLGVRASMPMAQIGGAREIQIFENCALRLRPSAEANSVENLEWGWAFVAEEPTQEPRYFCYVYRDRNAGSSAKCVVNGETLVDSAQQLVRGFGDTTLRLDGLAVGPRLTQAEYARMRLPAEPDWAGIYR